MSDLYIAQPHLLLPQFSRHQLCKVVIRDGERQVWAAVLWGTLDEAGGLALTQV